MRFEEAVRIINGADGQVFNAINSALTIALVAAVPATKGASLALFDVKNDVVRMLGDLWKDGFPKRIRAAGRRERVELLDAAHVTIVLSAFFDVVAEHEVLGKIRLTKADIQLLSSERLSRDRQSAVDGLLSGEVQLPRFDTSYSQLSGDLDLYYERLWARLMRHLRNLAAWDRLSENDQQLLNQTARGTHANGKGVPRRATERCHLYRGRLAAQAPEYAFWTNLWEHLATRSELRNYLDNEVVARLDRIAGELHSARTGLSGLPTLLGLVDGKQAGAYWSQLAEIYHRQFSRPVVDAQDQSIPDGLVLPPLRYAYVNPCFRIIGSYGPGVRPSEERWWLANTTIRDDLQKFFAIYLTAPESCGTPLLVLGDPGAGKSVLTRALAANLGQLGYRAVRVDLRDVAATAPVIVQIQSALQTLLKRDVDWADLADAVTDGIPVVILDGFDELLQTSGVNQSDYLEQVWEFQQTELARNRPTIVVVTSRTLVAHRARIPAGSTIVRLEPFGEDEITTWLDRWNSANLEYYSASGLAKLDIDTVRRYSELSRQPLLLLMLALYDAGGNALQSERHDLADAELYERLLKEFTVRQMRKRHPRATDETLDGLADEELTGLSITALAMFNRSQLHISQDELDEDLRALLPRSAGRSGQGHGMHERFTAAELLVDRFFFIHESQKKHGSATAKTVHAYEFMHATFGEYLVSRFLGNALLDLLEYAEHGPRRLAAIRTEVEDGLLSAVTSFEILSARESVLKVLSFRLRHLTDGQRGRLRAVLSELLRSRLHRFDPDGYSRYEPRELDGYARLAYYTANLVLLTTNLATVGVPLRDLLGDHPDVIVRWRGLAHLWQAGLDATAWNSLIRAIQLSRPPDAEPVLSARVTETQRFDSPGTAEVYLTAELVPNPALDRLLAAVRGIAHDHDELLGTDGSPVEALLDLLLSAQPVGKEDPASELAEERFGELLAAAFATADKLNGLIRDSYLSTVLRTLGGPGFPRTGLMTELELLRQAVALVQRSKGLPQLCATIIDRAQGLKSGVEPLDEALTAISVDAAAQLGDVRQIPDPRIRLQMLLTLADLELSNQTVPLRVRFREAIVHVPGLAELVDESTLLPLIRAVTEMQLRSWARHYGPGLLTGVRPELLATIPEDLFERILTLAFDPEHDGETRRTELRKIWAEAAGRHVADRAAE